MRRWSGIVCLEGVQTGDGRFIVEGALEWSDPPLPLGWLQEEMHGSMLTGGTQVGTVETIERRDGGVIWATGTIDDENPDGAELCRRMEAGAASHGDAVFVSVDPDNWEVELVYSADEDEEGGVVIVASGDGQPGFRPVTAAAGDGDPGEEGEVVWTESVDQLVERYTRLRIRGVTCCAVPAFDGAFISLEGAAETTEEGPNEDPVEPDAETAAGVTGEVFVDTRAVVAEIAQRLGLDSAAMIAAGVPLEPPAAWFEDPGFTEDHPLLERDPRTGEPIGVPFTILDSGEVLGHLAAWGTCHIGNPEVCTTPPTSAADYAYFTTGAVRVSECEECRDLRSGVVTMGGGHAPLSFDAAQAAAHYDETGTAVADIMVGEDRFGIWVHGALRPGVTADQVRELRSASLSGDWRRIGGTLELVAALAVNVPGFPIPRSPRTQVAAGTQVALVAAGALEHPDPEERRLQDIEARLANVERVAGPLRALAADRIAGSIEVVSG